MEPAVTIDDGEDPSDDGVRSNRMAIMLGLLALVVVLAVVAYVVLNDDADDSGSDADGNSSSSSQSSSGSQSTSSEISSSGSAPETSPAPASTEAPPATPTSEEPVQTDPKPTGVSVFITSQSWNSGQQTIDVVGSVQGVTTEESTCTATASSGPAQVSASGLGVFTGTGTACGLIQIPLAGQPRGTWSVVITFEWAGGAPATSSPVQVEVPA